MITFQFVKWTSEQDDSDMIGYDFKIIQSIEIWEKKITNNLCLIGS